MLVLDGQTARSIAYDYCDPDKYVRVESKMLDTTRWGIINRVVFIDKASNKYYAFTFEEGATEMQDYDEFEDGSIEAYEVAPFKVTVTEFHKV